MIHPVDLPSRRHHRPCPSPLATLCRITLASGDPPRRAPARCCMFDPDQGVGNGRWIQTQLGFAVSQDGGWVISSAQWRQGNTAGKSPLKCEAMQAGSSDVRDPSACHRLSWTLISEIVPATRPRAERCGHESKLCLLYVSITISSLYPSAMRHLSGNTCTEPDSRTRQKSFEFD